MKRAGNKRGICLLVVGLSLILSAGLWYGCNLQEDKNAGERASRLLDKLEEQRQEIQGEDSPVIVVDGEAFCGTISIDRLDVELPVFQEWSESRLKEAPCRYAGSVDTEDMIIAAHNYKHHFGNLKELQSGDPVIFTDAYGMEHSYEVREIITLDGTAVTDMKSGQWDFTLFTCTKGGKQRVTVRCVSIE